MASDDNVVKLKHLQPFANGISFPNGDNVVRLKHLVSLASAIADESLDSSTQQPVLSLGSWSAADSIYSAEIFYNGDGTLSTDIGSISNGFLYVEDADGCFSGVLTATTNFNFNLNTPVLIDSFTITPNELTIPIGESSTAEISISTSPLNSSYSLSTINAPEWVSIDDTTIIFAPPAGTTANDYLFTVVATTKDDRTEFPVTLEVEEKEYIKPTLSATVSETTYTDTRRRATLTASTNNSEGAMNWQTSGTMTIEGGVYNNQRKITANYKDWGGTYYSSSGYATVTVESAGDYAESAMAMTLRAGYSDATTKEPIKIATMKRLY